MEENERQDSFIGELNRRINLEALDCVPKKGKTKSYSLSKAYFADIRTHNCNTVHC